MNIRAPELSALITILRSVGRSRDLDAAVQQRLRHRLDRPLALAKLASLGQELRQLAGVQALLPLGAGREQLATPGTEPPLQVVHERDRLRAEHFFHRR